MKPRYTLRFGVLTNSTFDVFQRDILSGIHEVALRRGYDVDVMLMPRPDHPLPALDGLAGVIVIANCAADDHLRRLYETGMPMSLISHHLPDLPIPVLSPDNFEGVQILMKHLVEDCQRSRIVFIQGDLDQKDGIKRDAIFQREMMRYNLDPIPDFILPGAFIPQRSRALMQALVATRRDFDAVLASDYLMGLQALDVLANAAIAVPGEVVVVGFGDAPEAEQAGLTTVAADVVELGRRAARQVIGQIEGLLIRGTTLISAELVRRRTSC